MSSHVIGIDLGGTKIAAGLIATDRPTEVIQQVRTATPAASQIIPTIAELIAPLIDTSPQPIHALGIGAPGVIDPARGTVVSAGPTMPGWAGTPLREQLHAATGLEVHVANDVRALGLGESRYGAGARYGRTLFLSLGTGVGGALVIDGQLASSPHFTAGELRRVIGRGFDGTATPIEEFASGTGLAATYHRAAGHSGPATRSWREIMADYEQDDLAQRVLKRCMLNLGEAIAGLASAIDIDAIVLGGGVGSLGDVVLCPFKRAFRTYALQPLDTIDILPAQLGQAAPIIGAAALVPA
ncbi:Fructokinase [Corynebacterium ciconiae DSM 44920]|uniref:ROK family protein n=1 Tax=Corynebacterium ciconiae TaxID=227319 RepID=UPI000362E91A|nr:ROK family protein [Corynebacterium ciconiae]WKD62032.1 Fructokinase [Corynebacterium ciconiae DSM 44920]